MANIDKDILENGLKELKKLSKLDDLEEAHIKADIILLNMIDDEEITKAHGKAAAWYS